MTKSKWYFVVPVLILLLVDQSYKKNVNFMKSKEEDVTELETRSKQLSSVINIVIIALILIGTAHYMFLQYNEYGDKFSLYKFFVGWSKCKEK
jgi:hypothetical protein